MGLFGGGGSDGASEARALEEQRKYRIDTGMDNIDAAFAGFNPQFYQQRQQDYINYAMPQLHRQFGQTNQQGMYSLADRGLAKGSAANKFGSNLGYETNVQKQGIVDTAALQRQQLQQQIEQQRSQVVAQLQASADPTTAAQQAIGSAAAYSLPSAFQPLGNMFGNFAQIYANQQLGKAYNPQQYQPQYGLPSSSMGNKSAYSIQKK